MEGFTPADGVEEDVAALDYQPLTRIVTPLGMSVQKVERADLDGNPTEVRISFLLGFPPGIISENLTVRIGDAQARKLVEMLTGGIVFAHANEVPL